MRILKAAFAYFLFIVVVFLSINAKAQTQKQVTHQSLVWLASVNTVRFNQHWGAIADLQFRTYDFLSHSYAYFARGFANYWFNNNVAASAGYAHIWTAPTKAGPKLFSNENRITEQVQFTTGKEKFSVAHRWRLEQRWQQKIVSNQKTNDYRFTNRLGYAIKFTYAPFENKSLPALVNSEEVLLQFGKEVVYNTFDQARFSFGIKENLTPHLNVDLNYMYSYQQQYSGNQYLSANILRLYFNYNLSWEKDNITKNK